MLTSGESGRTLLIHSREVGGLRAADHDVRQLRRVGFLARDAAACAGVRKRLLVGATEVDLPIAS